jgi:hypothetical protein
MYHQQYHQQKQIKCKLFKNNTLRAQVESGRDQILEHLMATSGVFLCL